MIWSGAKLRENISRIVADSSQIEENKFDCAAFTLTMGDEVYVSPTEFHSSSDLVLLKEGEGFNIPPGQFAFLLTEERLTMPPDVLGANQAPRVRSNCEDWSTCRAFT